MEELVTEDPVVEVRPDVDSKSNPPAAAARDLVGCRCLGSIMLTSL